MFRKSEKTEVLSKMRLFSLLALLILWGNDFLSSLAGLPQSLIFLHI